MTDADKFFAALGITSAEMTAALEKADEPLRGLGSGEVCSCGHPVMLHEGSRCWPAPVQTRIRCGCRKRKPVLWVVNLGSYRLGSKGNADGHALMRGMAKQVKHQNPRMHARRWLDGWPRCEACGTADPESGPFLPHGFKDKARVHEKWLVKDADETRLLCTGCATAATGLRAP